MRRVYVQGPVKVEELLAAGLDPVDLATMPRETPDENQRYLLARAQAMEEGYAPISFQLVKLLELEMRAAGMLAQNARPHIHVEIGDRTLQELLSWGHSRHALRANTPQTEESDLVRLPAPSDKR